MVMEKIKKTALNMYLKPPSLWVRHGDGVYAIIKKNEVEFFHNHLYTISTSIKFTKELEKSGQLVLLNVNVQQLNDRSLATSVYSKPTRANRYFRYSSHHPVNQKISVART